MRSSIVLAAFFVATANIALNFLASATARQALSWHQIFLTRIFWLTFAVGFLSLTCLVSLYFLGKEDKFDVANGILLAGSLSIILGSLVGKYFRGGAIHWSEWAIFTLIILFYLIRFHRTN